MSCLVFFFKHQIVTAVHKRNIYFIYLKFIINIFKHINTIIKTHNRLLTFTLYFKCMINNLHYEQYFKIWTRLVDSIETGSRSDIILLDWKWTTSCTSIILACTHKFLCFGWNGIIYFSSCIIEYIIQFFFI